VFSARCVVSWAVPKDVFDCLYSLATRASDLVGGMLGEKPLGVGANEGVTCDETV